MRGFSKAIITGNLARDPELRSTTGGSSVCSFVVAVNRTYKGADGQNKEEVSYIDCLAWARLGEMIAQYARRGTGVLVSGRLYQHSWEDKNGGGKRSRVEIVVEDFNFVGGGNRENGGASGGAGASAPSASANDAGASGDAGMDNIPDDIPEGEIDLSDVPF